MWTKIDSYLIVADIEEGDHITQLPDDPQDVYEIKSLPMGFVKALHANGKTAMKIFPDSELIKGKWWVKK
jgi:hypothetical protein